MELAALLGAVIARRADTVQAKLEITKEGAPVKLPEILS